MTDPAALTGEELETVSEWVDAGEPLASHYARAVIAALRASREAEERQSRARSEDIAHLRAEVEQLRAELAEATRPRYVLGTSVVPPRSGGGW